MYNHARNLLVNVSGGSTGNTLGDELTPETFKAVSLGAGQLAVRRLLFGADPDQYMLNYRARQLLAMIHASPLVEYVTALDPRITYRFDTAEYFSEAVFKPTVINLIGESELTIQSVPAAPDRSGRMWHSLRIDVIGSNAITVRRNFPLGTATYSINLDDPFSSQYRLGESGYLFRVRDGAEVGDAWMVEVLNRPQDDLGQLVANLERVGEPALLEIFGLSRDEPYATFRNLWQSHTETPLRLGGLVMALIYSTEARRG